LSNSKNKVEEKEKRLKNQIFDDDGGQNAIANDI
jgi:hypothetical protein